MVKVKWAASAESIADWLADPDVSPGNTFVYYTGASLTTDRSVFGSNIGIYVGTAFNQACTDLYFACKKGKIALVQDKIADRWYNYCAVKLHPTRKSGELTNGFSENELEQA